MISLDPNASEDYCRTGEIEISHVSEFFVKRVSFQKCRIKASVNSTANLLELLGKDLDSSMMADATGCHGSSESLVLCSMALDDHLCTKHFKKLIIEGRT